MNYILFVAFKMLFERRRQTLVSVLGVSVGVCAFIVMSSLMLGFQNYFIQQVIDLEPHIKIKPREEAQEVEKYTILLGAKPIILASGIARAIDQPLYLLFFHHRILFSPLVYGKDKHKGTKKNKEKKKQKLTH